MWTPRRLFENVIGHAGIVAGDAIQDAIERNDTRRKEGAFAGSLVLMHTEPGDLSQLVTEFRGG